MIMKEGHEVERIIFPDVAGEAQIIALGVLGVIKITVSMQNGQMAPVPWFEVLYENGKTQLWNGALVEGITLV